MLGFFILGNGRVTLLWELTTAADNETAALIIVNVSTSAIEGIEHYDECIDRASEMFTVMSAGAIATGFLCLLLLPVAATALKASAALCRRVDASNTRHALASIIREERQAASEVSCSSSDPRRCRSRTATCSRPPPPSPPRPVLRRCRAPTPPPEESEVSASALSSGLRAGRRIAARAAVVDARAGGLDGAASAERPSRRVGEIALRQRRRLAPATLPRSRRAARRSSPRPKLRSSPSKLGSSARRRCSTAANGTRRPLHAAGGVVRGPGRGGDRRAAEPSSRRRSPRLAAIGREAGALGGPVPRSVCVGDGCGGRFVCVDGAVVHAETHERRVMSGARNI